MSSSTVTPDLRWAIEQLERIAADWSLLDDLSEDDRRRFHRAVAAVFEPDPATRRRRLKTAERTRRAAAAARAEQAVADTGIRVLRRQPLFTTPNVFPPTDVDTDPATDRGVDEHVASASGASASGERCCYVCKETYTEVHHFYDQLCPPCAAFNFAKRTELADLRGRVALLTGGRVKIGYQAGVKLLRAGARLIVTSRFPHDAAARYAAEVDFGDWGDRLQIVGLDLRHTPSVEALCRELVDSGDRLDFIVNNACQTVRRPPAFYRHLIARERAAADESSAATRRLLAGRLAEALPAVAGLTRAADLSQAALLPEDLIAGAALFPTGQLDQDQQQIDLRTRNSWRLFMDEVSSIELLEVHLVNAVAPFILNARLKALMRRTPGRDKHIVNVSAVEGQFYRRFKTSRHPHTNMAKAALNMMTRTAATDYVNDGIHMNSVDTGWVTDEDPEAIAARKRRDHHFHPPLDIVDGAARIVDPIISGINTGTHVWGRFLKNYTPTDW